MKKKLIKWLAIPAAAFLLLFVGVLTMGIVSIVSGNQAQQEYIANSFKKLSAEVEAYRGLVDEIAIENEIGDYTNHLLCVMQVSTSGVGTDIMNAGSFESNTKYPHEKGMITDPEYSITCGVLEFKALLQLAGVENPTDKEKLQLVYQAYHIDRGYISFTTQYTPENAADYCTQNSLGDYYNTNFAQQVSFYLASLNGSGDFKYPLQDYHSISSPFGYRSDPFTGEIKFHSGTDFPAPAMTPVLASMDGVVEKADWNGGYGNCVIIRHNATYQTLYGHNTAFNVSAGQEVRQGDIIAFVGTTGNSTGNHCHFEIRVNGECVDAIPFLENQIESGVAE